jgi:hypothetical protein
VDVGTAQADVPEEVIIKLAEVISVTARLDPLAAPLPQRLDQAESGEKGCVIGGLRRRVANMRRC